MSKRKDRNRDRKHIAAQERQVAALVADWTPRLGLSDWRIIHEVTAIDATARAWISDNYPNVHLQFAPLPGERSAGWFKPESALEESVVHELVHVMMREVDTSFADAIEILPKKLRRRAFNDYDNHRENFVERLSRAFVAVKSGERSIGRICDGKGDE